jgi:choline-glycine betaine transporter
MGLGGPLLQIAIICCIVTVYTMEDWCHKEKGCKAEEQCILSTLVFFLLVVFMTSKGVGSLAALLWHIMKYDSA